jgi:hypothetical protein
MSRPTRPPRPPFVKPTPVKYPDPVTWEEVPQGCIGVFGISERKWVGTQGLESCLGILINDEGNEIVYITCDPFLTL